MTTADLFYISPLIVLAAAAVLGMVGIAIRRSHEATFLLAMLALILSFVSLRFSLLGDGQYVAGLIRLDGYAIFFVGLMLAAGMVVILMAHGYTRRCSMIPEESYVLVLMAVLGCSVLVSSVHFASFFIGLELLTVSLYTLIAYCRSRREEIEAGVKYFIPAAASSAFLLFGMALVYAQTGTMSLPGFALQVGTSDAPAPVLVLLGGAMMLAAIGFKLALAPFHLWAADVYEGSPVPATALIATASKGAVFAILFRYFGTMQLQASESFTVVFTAIAILSMFVGNLLALLQNNLKRMLAYSSIAHMGYLLIVFIAGGTQTETALMFYLLAYFITILGMFGVIAVLSESERDLIAIEDYRGLALRRPFLGFVLALMMFSLAGIPLTAGFLGKFYIVLIGVRARLWLLVFALVANSVLGLFYYLRVVLAVYEPVPHDSQKEAVAGSLLTKGLLAVLAFLVLAVGVYPGPAIRLIESLQSTLR